MIEQSGPRRSQRPVISFTAAHVRCAIASADRVAMVGLRGKPSDGGATRLPMAVAKRGERLNRIVGELVEPRRLRISPR